LDFYYGCDWHGNLQPSNAAKKYVQHIESTSFRNPILLIPYIYHCYMALLAGGQIIKGWAIISMQLPKTEGTNIFDFNSKKFVQRL